MLDKLRVKLPFLLTQMVQPWCNLSRNYRNNRHNRHFYPHFFHSVDIIETIDVKPPNFVPLISRHF